MTFEEYQQAAEATAVYPPIVGLLYCTLQLASEAGEVSGKLAKALRGDRIEAFDARAAAGTATADAMVDELGDVLWYVAMTAKELGVDLDTVATRNVEKLKSRAARGTLKGSGDDR